MTLSVSVGDQQGVERCVGVAVLMDVLRENLLRVRILFERVNPTSRTDTFCHLKSEISFLGSDVNAGVSRMSGVSRSHYRSISPVTSGS